MGPRLRVVVVCPSAGRQKKSTASARRNIPAPARAICRKPIPLSTPPATGPITAPSSPHTANSANHSARLRFPVGLAEGTGPPSRASIDGENRAPPTPVRQAPRIMGHSDAPARQQEKTGDANDAAGENDHLSAIAVGQRPAEDKHALLREGTQPRIRPISPPESSMSSRRKRARKGTTA